MSAGSSAFLLFLVSAGLPFGLPPAEDDAKLSHAAPDACLFYANWAASSDADGASANRTEQLLAEPEVQELIDKSFSGLKSMIASGVDSAAGPGTDEAKMMGDLAGLGVNVFYQSGALYIEKFTADDPASISAALISAMSKEDQDRLTAIITEIEKRAGEGPAGDAVTKIAIDGSEFRKIKIEDDAPPIYFGMVGGHVALTVGEGSAESLLKRLKAAATPTWLTSLHKTLPVERPNMVVYANMAEIKKLVKPTVDDPNVVNTIRALGLSGVQSVGAVSGLDGEDFVSRMHIETGEELTGLFSLAKAKPLTPADFASVPYDAFSASVVRLDGKTALDEILERSAEVDPVFPRMILGNFESIKDSFDIDVQEDLINSLGDRWTAYYPKNIYSGQVACISLRDHDRLEKTLEKLVSLAKGAFGEGGPKFFDVKHNGHKITVFLPPAGERIGPDMYLPSIPMAICLTDDELILGILPSVKNHLSVMSRQEKSFSDRPEIASLLSADNPPMAVFYVDTPKIYSTAYPLMQLGGLYAARGIESAREMAFAFGPPSDAPPAQIDLDISLLPTGRSVLQHLRPEVIGVIRRENGVEIQNRKVLPGVGMFAGLAFVGMVGGMTGADDPEELLEPIMGLVMPARKNEIDSQNNLRQIALAMHNYHDTYGHLPPAYSTDKDGKPLLSWRVLILPYMEQSALYDRFHLDEPWDSDHNKKLLDIVIETYSAPGSKNDHTKTNYQTVRMEGSPFEGAKGGRFAEITDGLSNTIMVVETADEKAVIWTKPDDFTPDAMKPTAGLVGLRKGGFLTAICDGSVHTLSGAMTAKNLLNFFIRNDGNIVDFGARE